MSPHPKPRPLCASIPQTLNGDGLRAAILAADGRVRRLPRDNIPRIESSLLKALLYTE